MEKKLIPKIIHYCWFGGADLDDLSKKCIASWKKYCPDYEIVRWDESNYDINKNKYMKQAYDAKKWSFVSDYARLDIVYNNGGVYLDTDVELVKSLDGLISSECYFGAEVPGRINTGHGFGSVKHHPIVKLMLDEYENRDFKLSNGKLDFTPCPYINTSVIKQFNFKDDEVIQKLPFNTTIYPTEYFCPLDFSKNNCNITKNTVSIHHWNGAWMTRTNRFNMKAYDFISRNFGKNCAESLKKAKHKIIKN